VTVNSTAPPPATTLTVDNTSSGASGTGWTASTYYAGFTGSNYLYSGNSGGTRFTWPATSLQAGSYDVFVWWPHTNSGRPTDVSYDVASAAGVTKVTGINQNLNGGVWNKLGTFTSPTSVTVISGSTGTEGTVADAVRFVAASGASAPSVSLTAPASGGTFTAPATITINANASTSSGTITKVDFYAGATLIGTDMSAPYSFTWSGVATGGYSLTANVTNSAGLTATSPAISVTVTGAPAAMTTALFTPSSDNATNVTSYNLEFFTAGANPSTATPVRSQNLGKPSIVNGEISVNVAATSSSLPAGTYFATVTAIGPGGSTRSAPSNTFTK
jgi:hypothetical protein